MELLDFIIIFMFFMLSIVAQFVLWFSYKKSKQKLAAEVKELTKEAKHLKDLCGILVNDTKEKTGL